LLFFAKLLTSKTADHASDYYERAWCSDLDHEGEGLAMKEKLTRQELWQMLPAYVYGALKPEQMLACQSYLQNHADPKLLRRYRDLEEMATQLAVTIPHVPLPSWIKEQLMSNVLADLNHNHNHKYHQWLIRSHTLHLISHYSPSSTSNLFFPSAARKRNDNDNDND